jgi:hypothetical protein
MKKLQERETTAERLSILKPYLLKLLEDAPDFGACGLEIVFHQGRISKVTTTTSVLKTPDEIEAENSSGQSVEISDIIAAVQYSDIGS